MNINLNLFYTIIIVFYLVASAIGYRAAQKATKNHDSDDYFLGNRSIGFLPLCLSFLATQLGGGVIIGTSEAAFVHGYSAISYALAISLGLILLSLGLGERFRGLEVATIPEVFQKVYSSRHLRVISSLVLIISTFFILVALAISGKKLFIGVGITQTYLFILFWLGIIMYTSIGGFNAVINTDILQIVFILATFTLVSCSIFLNSDLNHSALLESQANSNFYDMSLTKYFFMPLFFTLIGQDMGQRCFAAKSAQIVRMATLGSAILLAIAAMLPVSIGVMGRNLGISITNGSVLIDMVSSLTNPYIASFFAASVLLAIVSTADSLLCAVSSLINYDLLKVTKARERKTIMLLTFMVGLASMLLGLMFNDVLEVLVNAYELTISILFVPIIMALFNFNISKKTGYYSVYLGFIVWSVSRLLVIPCYEWLTLGSALAVFLIVKNEH